jgi:thymidylate kinase
MSAVAQELVFITGPSGAGKTSFKMQVAQHISGAAVHEEDGRGVSKAMRAKWLAEEAELIVVVTTESAVKLAVAFAKEHGLVPQVVFVQDPGQESTEYLDAIRAAAAHGIFSQLHVIRRSTPESSTNMRTHAWTLVETDSKKMPSWMAVVRFQQSQD